MGDAYIPLSAFDHEVDIPAVVFCYAERANFQPMKYGLRDLFERHSRFAEHRFVHINADHVAHQEFLAPKYTFRSRDVPKLIGHLKYPYRQVSIGYIRTRSKINENFFVRRS